MQNLLKLFTIIFLFCLMGCQESSKKADLDFIYTNQGDVLSCDGIDTALIQEAFYSFENDLTTYYTPSKPIYSRAYSIFISQALADRVNYSLMVSDHSKKVLEALKQDESLWTNNPDGSKVNFNHPIFECIGENIQDEPLKQTFNALIQTNSMSLRMFGQELRQKTFGMKDDKYLATYVAMELFYGKIYDKDFSIPEDGEVLTPNANVHDHSENDGHNHSKDDGHNH